MAGKLNKYKVTSKKAATAASKTMKDPKSKEAAKSAAGSALSQKPRKNAQRPTKKGK